MAESEIVVSEVPADVDVSGAPPESFGVGVEPPSTPIGVGVDPLDVDPLDVDASAAFGLSTTDFSSNDFMASLGVTQVDLPSITESEAIIPGVNIPNIKEPEPSLFGKVFSGLGTGISSVFGFFAEMAGVTPSTNNGIVSEEVARASIKPLTDKAEAGKPLSLEELTQIKMVNDLSKGTNDRQMTSTFWLTLLGFWYQERRRKDDLRFQTQFYEKQLKDAQLVQERQFQQQLQLTDVQQEGALEQIRAQNRQGPPLRRAGFTDFGAS